MNDTFPLSNPFDQDKSNLYVLQALLSFIGAGEEVMIVNTPNSWMGIHLEGLLMNKFPTVMPVPTVRIVRQPKEDEDLKLLSKCNAKCKRFWRGGGGVSVHCPQRFHYRPSIVKH